MSTTVIIDRRRWGRGAGHGNGQLADRNRQNCCCLGFLCNQVFGIPWNKLRNHAMPGQVSDDLKNSNWSNASIVNDEIGLRDVHREEELIEIFASRGFVLEFIN